MFERNPRESMEGGGGRETSQLLVTDGVSFDKWKCEGVIDFYGRFSYLRLLFVDKLVSYTAYDLNSLKSKAFYCLHI